MTCLALLLLLLPAVAAAFQCVPANSPVQCAALGDLYAATRGEQWRAATGWAEAARGAPTSFCSFSGVECSPDGGSVVKLRLALNKLVGSLPWSVGSLTGLEFLSFGFNELSGSLPASLGSLRALTTLNVRNNQLSGSLPAALGSLSALQQLELGSNAFSGTVPLSFDRLTVAGLWLSRSALCGELPPELTQRCSTGATWCLGFPLPAC